MASSAATVPQLPKRKLGNTGLEVSVMGFGASPLGGSFGPVDEAGAIAAVHAAFAAGVNFFDTSPYYGATRSETLLGKALKDLPRDQIVLATKVGRYGLNVEDFDFSAARVTASVHDSLERLQTDRLDLVYCHDVEFGDLDQVVNEALPALAALKAQGLVRHVGISGLPLGAFRYVLDKAPPGAVEVVLSYCHLCLNDTSLQQLLPYLEAKGVGVVAASALSMGMLTKAGPPEWHPAPPALRAAAAEAAALAESRGQRIEALGLRFAFKQPGVATTLVGMTTPDMVTQNVDAVLAALGIKKPAAADGEAAAANGEAAAADAAADAVVAELEQLFVARGVKDVTWPSGRPLPAGY
ncbi:hypothetical protein CHLRE_14g630400v5 [Chlamydomonas reinhardtii]|uniref:NADP-dependent oxidoreductase domain-containing protein n=1 Tax=Chlamydomonas reinhardtii TaxID=3055 RepID=A0A2K3CYM5_CHLRE|nr:uncharacterized protein CHLRE_14g630400v5 [Chlamydomonas reinhardtii]PNW73386.1 hypothetical protein CHLRE_14g630400v5 [Chlamydomonas reinhardtii]